MWTMRHLRSAIVALVLTPTFLWAKSDVPLEDIAERFAHGKTYKLNPSAAERQRGEYDCTTFVQAVLKEAGLNVGGTVGNQININVPGITEDSLKSLVETKDPRIQGVVTALVDSMQGARVLDINDLKPGDVIQMWRITGNAVKGHAGIVKSVDRANDIVSLVGAHVDGVGLKQFRLGQSGWNNWFAVRPNK